jgi:hypothetical protein
MRLRIVSIQLAFPSSISASPQAFLPAVDPLLAMMNVCLPAATLTRKTTWFLGPNKNWSKEDDNSWRSMR